MGCACGRLADARTTDEQLVMANALNVAASTGSMAATGLALGGPIGAAIGAAVGFFGSIFSGGHPAQGPALRQAADQSSQELTSYLIQQQQDQVKSNQLMVMSIAALGAAVTVRIMHHERS